MTIRTPFAAALALVIVAAAAPSASAQHVVHSTPTYSYATPRVAQSRPGILRSIFLTPESNRPLSRPFWNVSGRDGFGVPFNNRPLLNMAYRLAW